MADISTLARPYAKAAFDYANEHGVIDEWEQFLFITSLMIKDPECMALLESPAISTKQKADIMVELYDKHIQNQEISSSQASWALKNFMVQLAEYDRLVLLPKIYEHFCHHKSKALKQIDAYITSAYPLTETQRVLIQSRLASSLNANVVLHEAVDMDLLAGVTIKIGDKVVDDSVRGKLKQLKTQLTI